MSSNSKDGQLYKCKSSSSDSNIVIIIIITILAYQHKAAGMKIKLSKNNDHDWVSDSRWTRNTVSPVSSVAAVMRLPISWMMMMIMISDVD